MKNMLKKVAALAVVFSVAAGLAASVQAAPTYLLDASNIPLQYQTDDVSVGGATRGMNLMPSGGMVTEMAGVEVVVAPGAAQPDFMWQVTGGTMRPGGSDVAGSGWIDSNGSGRVVETTVELEGPITIEIQGFSWTTPEATVVVRYGDQNVTFTFGHVEVGPDRIDGMFTVYHTFESGSGVVSIEWPWGPSGHGVPGRLGVRTVAIYEGGREAAVEPTIEPETVLVDTPEPVVTGQQVPAANDNMSITYAVGAALLLGVAVVIFAKKRAQN